MTVYVDDPRHPLGRMKMCHMLADTVDELHDMAESLGLKLEWFQGDHYDVSLAKRKLAVSMGAKEVTSRDLVELRRRRREE